MRSDEDSYQKLDYAKTVLQIDSNLRDKMKTARLTIKNYRGFSDQTPARLEIGTGLTALLGPNNAGKSSLKLFFYEMRGLFEVFLRGLGVNPSLLTAINCSPIGLGGYPGTSDLTEIFNNSNDRDITFEIEVIDPTVRPEARHAVNRLVATCERAAPLQWKVKVYSVQSPDDPVSSTNGTGKLIVTVLWAGTALRCLTSGICSK